MENIPKINLNFTGCKYLGELHLVIKEAFDFPDYYGQNWDAFWDLLRLTDGYVEVRGLNSLPEELKPSGEKVLEILQRNKEHIAQFVERNPQFDYYFDYKVID